MSNNRKSRILVIDDDLESLDLIAKQVLEPLGYSVATAIEGGAGLQQAVTAAPEILIVSLSLHGLSGKDVLAALRSQNFDSPIIVIAPKNDEAQALGAFRLGARDYLVRPLREAEIVAAVDRILDEGRLRRERAALQQQLQQANADLEQRVRELTNLSGIGKAVVNLSDINSLFTRLVESALLVTSGEMGWMLLTDDTHGQMLLTAAKNMPGRVQLLQPWDDGLASLVRVSGEPLTISGVGLSTMKVSQIAKSVLVVPIKVREQTVGVLTVAHKTPIPFTDRQTLLLNSVADYASIAIVNMRLFQALEQRAHTMQQQYDQLQESEKRRAQTMYKLSQEMRGPVAQAKSWLDTALTEIGGKLKETQRTPLKNASEKLAGVWQLLEDLTMLFEPPTAVVPTLKPVKLDELARQVMAKHQAAAQQREVALLASIAASVIVPGDQAKLARVFDALIGNAIKFSPRGGEVVVSMHKDGSNAQVTIADRGIGIATENLPYIFERFYQVDSNTNGIGLGLALVKQIVETHGGQVWAESTPGQGSRFYFTLPKAL
jgi:signal transduction histidine kinase/FixJ family two-component response regulator